MKKKIVLIDDCLPILNSLRILLEMHNYDVEMVQNGCYTLDNKKGLPDILLMDYHIPDINMEALFKQSENYAIPVILMSGDNNIEEISLLLGANDFIAKPFNIKDLLNKIERCISVVECHQEELLPYISNIKGLQKSFEPI